MKEWLASQGVPTQLKAPTPIQVKTFEIGLKIHVKKRLILNVTRS